MSRGIQRGPIAIVLGTRPEIIKLARITELLGDDAYLVHTGQHFDSNLSDVFFTEFDMRPPDTFVGIGGQSRGEQIGNGTVALDQLFASLRPSAVVVQGDTNTVLAGAIAANANEIPLVHVEAGLRSFDRRMPEEHNRVAADHLSDLCLAPTDINIGNLRAEGITDEAIVKTGNTIVEAVERLMPNEDERSNLLERYGVQRNQFALATFHRPENVDTRETLEILLNSLGSLDFPVLLPLHPRTQQRMAEFELTAIAENLKVIDPIGYRDFIGLGAESRMVISDSGGVQEEVSVYKKPAVVIRRSTERQEVEGTFVQRLEPDTSLASRLSAELDRSQDWAAEIADMPSPFGDSLAPEKSVHGSGRNAQRGTIHHPRFLSRREVCFRCVTRSGAASDRQRTHSRTLSSKQATSASSSAVRTISLRQASTQL
jgi:UDP-N-acetylglucosamine 2-epimerase (non-hydrolysing)